MQVLVLLNLQEEYQVGVGLSVLWDDTHELLNSEKFDSKNASSGAGIWLLCVEACFWQFDAYNDHVTDAIFIYLL